MQRLRILHIPTSYPDPEYGQPYALIFVAEHVHSAALYHDNVVLHVSPNHLLDGGLLKISTTLEQDIPTIRIHVRRSSGLLRRLLVYWGLGTQVLRLMLGGFRPDVIHAHIFSEARLAMVLSRWLHIPLIITEHWSALCRDGALPHRRLEFAKQVYEQADFVLPVCNYLRNCIETNTGAKMKSRIIFNAVDTKLFYDDGRERKRQILCVARLDVAKDIPTLLRSLMLLKDKSVKLKIVGRGDAEPLIALSKELGISEQVKFLGEQNKSAIAELMRESAVFALSSLWENSPCVIGESLCCGLPVASTSVGGVPELVSQADGRLVPHSQPEAMARALEEILGQPQQFNGHAIAERAKARFGYEAIGAQLDEVYREAVHA